MAVLAADRKHIQVSFEFYSKVSFILPAGQRNELASSRHSPWRWKAKVSLLVLGRLSISRKPSHTEQDPKSGSRHITIVHRLCCLPTDDFSTAQSEKNCQKLVCLWTWQHFKGRSLTMIPSEPATMHAVVMPAQLSAALRLDGVGRISMRSCDPCSKLQRLYGDG